VTLSYLRRWQIEETTPLAWFAKQVFRVEDIRIRKYDRLQNMIAIAAAAVHFVAVWLGGGEAGHPRSPLAETPPSAGLFVIPNFRYYALADGIKALLEGSETAFRARKALPRADPQLMLPI
jgi:hypothetical protein